jgi:hypothetical protein
VRSKWNTIDLLAKLRIVKLGKERKKERGKRKEGKGSDALSHNKGKCCPQRSVISKCEVKYEVKYGQARNSHNVNSVFQIHHP